MPTDLKYIGAQVIMRYYLVTLISHLMVYLRAKGIYSLGTVRVNRIPNCKLPNDSAIKEKPRGFSVEYVGSSYGVEVSNVLWKDNKAVRLLSTYVTVKPFISSNTQGGTPKAARYDRKSKRNAEIDCPQVIWVYNAHMEGVVLMDGLMGRYHIRSKTQDAATRIFYHLVDMATTNAYILYRRIQKETMSSEEFIELPNFRESIAAGLVGYQSKNLPGRPLMKNNLPSPSSSLSARSSRSPSQTLLSPISRRPLQPQLKQGQKSNHPIKDLRFDHFNHFPELDRITGKRSCKHCKT
ncbi:uncharacterized protein LOC124460996 [Drosophila willistoni]|uniref:uncharacterized protein LOC124460996 n=1 Tax=Drosophila willistoni TaxID=7260 RepID=UPI001F0719BD|nr:uncharacterized protein LOC124460996 [Drosophila willistoni]